MSAINIAASRRHTRHARRRTYLVTVAYHACRVSEVSVRAADPSRACSRAIEIADGDGDGWHPTDDASESYVEAVEVGGESITVPAEFSEVGILRPGFGALLRGLETVVGIAEDRRTDPVAALEQISSAARAVLARAQP